MSRLRAGIAVLALVGLMSGCEQGATPETLPDEQKAPDYGQKSADQMKSMYGAPGANGKMEKANPK